MASIRDERKREKALIVLKYFLDNNGPSTRKMEEELGISRSQIQRYLRDPIVLELISELGILDAPQVIDKLLKRNWEEGSLKGGLSYADKYELTQDEAGRITGYKTK